MKSILFLLSLLSISCVSSSAWIVESRQGGGIIGYQMGSSSSAQIELDRKFDIQARRVCNNSGYNIIRDSLASRQSNYSYVIPQTSTTNSTYDYSGSSYATGSAYGSGGYATGSAYGTSNATARGTQTTTTYVPVSGTRVDYWREAEIECSGLSAGYDSDAKPVLGIEADMAFDGRGVLIKHVEPYSIAASIGLAPGDLIIEVGYRSVKDLIDLKEILSSIQPPTSTVLKHCRENHCRTSDVTFSAAH